MIQQNVHTVILGGGLAGLSLVRALMERAPDGGSKGRPQILIVEPRASYSNDKTWCFWGTPEQPLAHQSWPNWSFNLNQETHQHKVKNQRYHAVRAIDFYHHVLQQIEACDWIHLATGVQAHGVQPGQDHCVVDTDQGPITTEYVVDTRPPDPQKTQDSVLMQSFKGIEIETDFECFDTQTATLMGSMGSDEHGFHFTYVLPFSPYHALIEPTRFHAKPLPPNTLNTDLLLGLKHITDNQPYRVLRQEQGRIPMGQPPLPQHHPRWVMAGTRGGAVRASSGYAFSRIQQWAERCAQSMHQHHVPCGHPEETLIYRWMDHLFLSVLRQDMVLAPLLFSHLAARVKAPSLLRFLSGQAGPLDFLRIIKALPAGPFLKQMLSDVKPTSALPGSPPTPS